MCLVTLAAIMLTKMGTTVIVVSLVRVKGHTYWKRLFGEYLQIACMSLFSVLLLQTRCSPEFDHPHNA